MFMDYVKKIYSKYMLRILLCISYCLAKLFVHLSKIISIGYMRNIDYNLDLIFPKKSKCEKHKIKLLSLQNFILNVFIGLHNRLIHDNDEFNKNISR